MSILSLLLRLKCVEKTPTDLRRNPRWEGFDEGELDDDATAFYGGLGDGAGHRRRGEQRSSDPDEHFYLPISPTPSAVDGGSRSLEVETPPLPRDAVFDRRDYTGFHQASIRDEGGREGDDAGLGGGVSGNREGSDSSGVGFMDVLRPFLAPLKLW